MKLLYLKMSFASIILLNSCAITTVNKSEDMHLNNENNENIENIENIETILSMILDHADFIKYIHPEIEGRIPLRIVTTDNMGVDFTLKKFGKTVIFYDVSPKNEDKPLIQIESFVMKNDEIEFSMSYKVEGLIIQGHIINKDENWEFTDFSLIES